MAGSSSVTRSSSRTSWTSSTEPVHDVQPAAPRNDPQAARGKALGTLMVGTLQLSRALTDEELSAEVLEQGVLNALALMH